MIFRLYQRIISKWIVAYRHQPIVITLSIDFRLSTSAAIATDWIEQYRLIRFCIVFRFTPQVIYDDSFQENVIKLWTTTRTIRRIDLIERKSKQKVIFKKNLESILNLSVDFFLSQIFVLFVFVLMCSKTTSRDESFCWEDNAEEKSHFQCKLAIENFVLVSENPSTSLKDSHNKCRPSLVTFRPHVIPWRCSNIFVNR